MFLNDKQDLFQTTLIKFIACVQINKLKIFIFFLRKLFYELF